MNALYNILTRFTMAYIRHAYWNPLIKLTRDPKGAQTTVLLKILSAQQKTTYGTEHDFRNIKSVEAYQRNVPVNRYEDLRSYFERQEKDSVPCINSQQPSMYAQTSGTTGKSKYIPILRHTIAQYRRSQHLVAFAKYNAIPGVFSGKVLAIVSPAVEGTLDSGTPYGSMSGLIYKSMPRLVRSKYVVPNEVFELDDYEQKYYLIAKHALAEKEITMIATANPSTLLKLDNIINDEFEPLVTEIEADNHERSSELRRLRSKPGRLSFGDVWPGLRSVTTWTNGSCKVLIPRLESLLPDGARIVEMGYLCSEFRGSITVDIERNLEIPSLLENFFEFVEKSEWEAGVHRFLTIDQIEEGKQYYVFATTANGLYRYDIDDIVEVTGRFNATPTIRFVQKGKGATNLTGEKIYENQLVDSVRRIETTKSVDIPFFVMLGCPRDLEYTLYLEHEPFDAADVERTLSELNSEFDAKRRSGRLKPLQIVFLNNGAGEAYKRAALMRGQRESQYKVVHLQYKEDCLFDFADYVQERFDLTH